MKRLLLTLLLLPAITLAADATNYGNAMVSEVTSIYDADTFRANINGWPPVVGERMPIRVNGVDAPEIRGKCEAEKLAAREAKQFTVAMLRGAKKIELRNLQRGKYFRLLADVYVDGKSLTTALIEAGHARPYHGGTREGWCHE
jgi:endonuclease YncB( thermonuclease family)